MENHFVRGYNFGIRVYTLVAFRGRPVRVPMTGATLTPVLRLFQYPVAVLTFGHGTPLRTRKSVVFFPRKNGVITADGLARVPVNAGI